MITAPHTLEDFGGGEDGERHSSSEKSGIFHAERETLRIGS